jgi:hypothetical protein
LFPNNRSFVRLTPNARQSALMPGIPVLPPGIGPQTGFPNASANGSPAPTTIGPTNLPGMLAMPQMPTRPPGFGLQARIPGAPVNGPSMPVTGGPTNLPQMPAMGEMGGGRMPARPMMPMLAESLELSATGDTTNLLGYLCARYQLQQRGETMDVWATDQLLPFPVYLENQLPRGGSRRMEEQWANQLAANKLFPLLAILKLENGSERFRYEVKSVTPQKPEEQDAVLFIPPAGYQELEPLPF